jgi:hypothetical protein
MRTEGTASLFLKCCTFKNICIQSDLALFALISTFLVGDRFSPNKKIKKNNDLPSVSNLYCIQRIMTQNVFILA